MGDVGILTGSILQSKLPGWQHQKKHQRNGIGSLMLREVLTLTIMISEYVGCRIITVDAKPESVGFYERFGFKRAKSRRSDPVPMYMDYHRLLEEEHLTG